jgi:hypothetical protein
MFIYISCLSLYRMQTEDAKKDVSKRGMFLAMSGAMIVLGASAFGYWLFGFYTGLSFVMMIMGTVWYAQTLAENFIESIEIKIKQE